MQPVIFDSQYGGPPAHLHIKTGRRVQWAVLHSCQHGLLSISHQAGHPRGVFVFMPGWAFRGEILWLLDKPDEDMVLISPQCPPWRVERRDFMELIGCVRTKYEKVVLAGWSLGAVVVHELLEDVSDQVDCAVFISPKARYGPDEIGFMKEYLMRDKAACLRYFYRECFRGQRVDYVRFRKRLEKRFIDSFSREELLEGLEFLYNHPLPKISTRKGVRTILLYGKNDMVAPPGSSTPLVTGENEIKHVVVENAGHLPFLRWNEVTEGIDV